MFRYLSITSLFFISLLSNIAWAKDHSLFESEIIESEVQSLPEFSNTSNNSIEGDRSTCREVGLQIDRYLSPVVGSDIMLSILRGYQALDDTFIPSTLGDSSGTMILGRVLKFLFIEEALFSTEMVTQHEIFGHGFRAREFRVPASYNISPWSGTTYLGATKFNQLSLSEKAAISTGGMEATGILAKELRNRWIASNIIDSREAHLYFLSNLDQTFYVLDTKLYRDKDSSRAGRAGHDVFQYISDINQWHQSSALTSSKLRRQVLVDFLDPYLFYSLYSMGLYLFEGNQSFEYPMISIGEYRYLPAMRLILAPYGTEYQLNNIIKGPEQNIQLSLKYGNTGGRHSSGLGLEVFNFFTSDLLFLDGKVDIWDQPRLFTATARSAQNRFGGALSLGARYRISPCIELKGQAGYKTKGYLPGEALKQSPILRIGFSAFL